MVSNVIAMGGSKTVLGCGKGKNCGCSGPQVVGKQVMILSLGPTNGRGGEQPRRLTKDQVGKKKTASNFCHMMQTQRRLPR